MFNVSAVFTSEMTEPVDVIRTTSTTTLVDGEDVNDEVVEVVPIRATVAQTSDKELSFIKDSINIISAYTFHTTYPLRMTSQRNQTLPDKVIVNGEEHTIVKVANRQNGGFTRAVGVFKDA